MLTPAQPVSENIICAACGVVTSPLPMTGIRLTACDDRADAGQIDRAAETLLPRPPMHKNRRRARVFQGPRQIRRGQISSSQPRRIFAVTGIFTASTMPRTSAAVFSNSVIMAEPPPTRQTLRTGQPILMSMAEMPMDSR